MTRILEVEEDGTLRLPSDVLREAKPHTRYILEERGDKLTLHPEPLEPPKPKTSRKKKELSWKEWENERNTLAEELAKVWPEGLSAVDAVNEQHR